MGSPTCVIIFSSKGLKQMTILGILKYNNRIQYESFFISLCDTMDGSKSMQNPFVKSVVSEIVLHNFLFIYRKYKKTKDNSKSFWSCL